MAVEPTAIRIRRGDLTLVGERWDGGRPAAAPAVLLHGGGQTRHSWHRTGERLARGGRTAFVLDARGHGDSDWDPERDYSLGAFVDDVVAWCATIAPPTPVLVGASLGGMTALAAAAENPGLARGIVMVDIVVDPEPSGVQRIKDFMRSAPEGFATLEDAADAIAAYNPHRPRPKNVDGLRKNLRQWSDGRWHWHWDPAVMARSEDDEPRVGTEPERLRRDAERLAVPALIVRGLNSDVVSDSGVRRMVELVPDARSVDVKAGHMVAGDDNDVFATELERFLDEVDPPAA